MPQRVRFERVELLANRHGPDNEGWVRGNLRRPAGMLTSQPRSHAPGGSRRPREPVPEAARARAGGNA